MKLAVNWFIYGRITAAAGLFSVNTAGAAK